MLISYNFFSKMEITNMSAQKQRIKQTITIQAEISPLLFGIMMPNCLRIEAIERYQLVTVEDKCMRPDLAISQPERRSWSGLLSSSNAWWSFLTNRSGYTDPKSGRDTPIILPVSFANTFHAFSIGVFHRFTIIMNIFMHKVFDPGPCILLKNTMVHHAHQIRHFESSSRNFSC